MHGGKSLKGAAAPAFKHGRWSEHLPAAMMERYLTASEDSDLLALREEIALTDSHIGSFLDELTAHEGEGAPWPALIGLYGSLRTAQAKGDVPAMASALDAIGKVIDGGMDDRAIWSNVHGLIAERRKLVEAEARRLGLLQQYITTEQMMTMVGALGSLVREHVHDQETLAQISAGLSQILEVRS